MSSPFAALAGGGGGNKFDFGSAAESKNQASRGGTTLGNVELGFSLAEVSTPVQYGILAIGALGLFYYVVKGRK